MARMLMVRHPQNTTIDLIDPTEGRSISLDIGPFEDQADLLNFAMLLESLPGVGHIDLMDAEPETALFVVRAPSADNLATLVKKMPEYTVTATSFGNMVSAHVQQSRRRAAAIMLPGVLTPPLAGYTKPVYIRHDQPRWWRRATLAAAMTAAAAALLFVSLSGGFSFGTSSVPTRPTVTPLIAGNIPTVIAPIVPSPAPAIVIPTATATTTAPAAPTQTPAAPAQAPAAPAATPVPISTPRPTPAPVAVVAARYNGNFASSLGSIRALNGCTWDTAINSTIEMTLTRATDGSLSGPANMAGTLSYTVTNTPSGAICNASAVPVEATGTAAGSGSVNASLSGARSLGVQFTGTVQGNQVVGDLTVQRVISATSSLGDTSEVRSATLYGVTLSRTN